MATYHQSMIANAATVTTAALASRISPSTRRRRRVARLAVSRFTSTRTGPLVVTTGADFARAGATTRRASRRLTGSRRARTRMVWEKRSTERLRTTSSWCRNAFGIR